MLTDIFKQALPVLEELEKHNYEAYYVGGCVRDFLLERPIKDIDITTSARPEEVQKIFPKVIPVGIEHGTVIVRHQGESYEVTTYRQDGTYSDNRHPDEVTFIRNIAEDLKRRDFTINALAMSKSGDIIDLFEGKKDVERKVIQTVGEGNKRFQEDALRIIRALRFSSQLGFEIEEKTRMQMIAWKPDISNLSVERITNEMEKFFAGDYIEKGIAYLKDTKIHTELPIFNKNQHLIDKLPKKMHPLPTFSVAIALFHYLDTSISVQEWAKAWKCSNRVRQIALELIDNLLYYEKYGLNDVLIYQLQKEHIPSFIVLVEILLEKKLILDTIISRKLKLPILSRAELKINGNDLLEIFPDKQKGPWIRDILNTLEEKVITGDINNNYHDIKEWLRWNPQEVN